MKLWDIGADDLNRAVACDYVEVATPIANASFLLLISGDTCLVGSQTPVSSPPAH